MDHLQGFQDALTDLNGWSITSLHIRAARPPMVRSAAAVSMLKASETNATPTQHPLLVVTTKASSPREDASNNIRP
jgi:hypothetical protein